VGATAGTLSWRTDPAPYGIVGYQQDLPNVEATQDPAGLRVVLRGEPLANDTLVMGDPWLNLTVKVDQPGGYVVAKLLDIKPDGSYSNVTLGYLNLKQRDGRDKSEDVPTGTDMQARVRMYGQAHVFLAGHRIGLLLAGNDPDINPGPTSPTAFTATVGKAGVALHVPVWTPDEAPWVFPPRAS
jgi:predicted acyl esterase